MSENQLLIAGASEAAARDDRRDAYVAGPRLVGHIGATNARFALEVAPGRLAHLAVLPCEDYPGLVEVVQAYLAGCPGPRPLHAAIATANPIQGDQVHLTNRDWRFSIEAARGALGLGTLLVQNDFQALAMALPSLAPQERRQVGGGKSRPDGPVGLVGAGTGLGISGLLPDRERWVALGSEGGHASFSPTNETELLVLRHAWRRYPHVSAERLISGPGLALIFEALAEDAGIAAHDRPQAPAIVTRALEADDPLCLRTLECFCGMLGTVAGNLAVTLNATGGIYIGGGIVPRLGRFFDASGFRRAFENKGRFAEFVAAIPTYVIVAEHPALLGVAALLRDHLKEHAGNTLLDRVRARVPELSPAEGRVGDLVLNQPRAFLNDPVADIAAKAAVSQPTVIRFCRSLGAEGLSDFKLKLAASLTGAVAVRHTQVRVGDTATDLAAKVLQNTGSAILRLRDHLDPAAIDRAIGLLCDARRIEMYGVGNSSVVALDGQHKFFRFGIPTSAYVDSHVQLMAAALLGEGDVVVAISKSGNLPEIVQAASSARQAGAAVIAITAGGSPLARLATVAIDVSHPEQEAAALSMVSRILHLLVIDILAVGVAMRRLAAEGHDAGVADLQRELASLQARFEALISHAS